MKLVYVQKIQNPVKWITQVGIHSCSLLDLVQKNYLSVVLEVGVDFVMELFVFDLSVGLEEGWHAWKDVAYAEQIYLVVETVEHGIAMIRFIIIFMI